MLWRCVKHEKIIGLTEIKISRSRFLFRVISAYRTRNNNRYCLVHGFSLRFRTTTANTHHHTDRFDNVRSH